MLFAMHNRNARVIMKKKGGRKCETIVMFVTCRSVHADRACGMFFSS